MFESVNFHHDHDLALGHQHWLPLVTNLQVVGLVEVLGPRRVDWNLAKELGDLAEWSAFFFSRRQRS